MEKLTVQRRLFSCGVAAWALLALLAPHPASAALVPESPEVKAAIARGVHWLESASDPRLGAKVLTGLVLAKNGSSPNHPKILEAVEEIRKRTRSNAEPSKLMGDVYTYGLSIIFLATLDPTQYRYDIQRVLDALAAIQKPHGGWGYLDRQTGDTSMTQYAVLAMWEARQAGFNVRQTMVENAADWLLRTQDPSGGFSYQGKVAPSPTALVAQDYVTNSLSTAGLGSLYICSELLGLVKPQPKKGVPSILKEVPKADRKIPTRIELRVVENTKHLGNQWMQANYRIDGDRVYYYLYALERYWSFREATEPALSDAPPWYDDAAQYILQKQQTNGSWRGIHSAAEGRDSVPDTAFCCLFLLRSMKKSIEKVRGYGPGVLVGGRGLPKGAAAVELRGGQVIAKPLAGPAQGLMAALENTTSAEYDQAVDALAELPADEARKLASQHHPKLRELMQEGEAETRLAIVQALTKSDDLEQVPTLIYALGDADPSVVLAARDGLRRISRKLDRLGLPDDFTEQERKEAIRRWKEWYWTLRPDAELENY